MFLFAISCFFSSPFSKRNHWPPCYIHINVATNNQPSCSLTIRGSFHIIPNTSMANNIANNKPLLGLVTIPGFYHIIPMIFLSHSHDVPWFRWYDFPHPPSINPSFWLTCHDPSTKHNKQSPLLMSCHTSNSRSTFSKLKHMHTSYTLWLCQNSYLKWLFIVDVPIKNGDFP